MRDWNSGHVSAARVRLQKRAEAEAWWRQAKADLETAEVVLQGGRYYAVTWFAQQTIEEGLKALYVEQRGALAPRTHDLVFLGRAVSAPPRLASAIALLSPAFDIARYPQPHTGLAPVDVIGEQGAENHLAATRGIMQWLEQELGGFDAYSGGRHEFVA